MPGWLAFWLVALIPGALFIARFIAFGMGTLDKVPDSDWDR